MLVIIALFGPSIIGLKFLDYFVKLNKKNTIYYFVILLTISITLNNIISYLFFNIADVIYHLNILPIYFGKYVFISLMINIVLAVILSIIIKGVSLKIEVENVEKNKKSTKSIKKDKNK